MKKLLPYLLVGGVLFALYASWNAVAKDWGAWEADTTRLFSQVEVDRLIHDTTEVLNRRDSVETARLLGVAERSRAGRERLQRVADSLSGVLREAQTPSDSLDVTLRVIETLQGALGDALGETTALRAAYAAQSLAFQRLKLDNGRAWADIDSLQAVIRRVPRGCRILGIPCPERVLGVGITTNGQQTTSGLTVAAGWKF